MRKNEMKLTFCIGDLVIIILAAAIAILGSVYFLTTVGAEEGSIIQVYQNGEMIREIPLSKETEFMIDGAYHNQVVVKDGKVSVAESDCPGTDCVQDGWIHESGRSIICLPNRVEIRIVGESEVDFIVQ